MILQNTTSFPSKKELAEPLPCLLNEAGKAKNKLLQTMKLTEYERNQVIIGIEQANRFIKKESPRNPDLRPADVQETLNNAIQHKADMIKMLAEDVAATYREIYA